MNVKNNKRHQETIDKTENALFFMLKDNELNNVIRNRACAASGTRKRRPPKLDKRLKKISLLKTSVFV